ncbi:MAG: hypothetical protein LUI10_09260 [Lachnospiraceae bacterium]|nr:hypothetical protein [Lachnospiraceae bacterium]
MRYIKKHAVVFFFLAESLVLAFFQTLGNTDRLWNYVFAENIASGLLPYRDFNLLQTPLSCAINAVFLSVFGHHMIVIDLLGGILFTCICMLLYRLCRTLGASRITSLVIPQFFLMLFCYNVFFEYSCLILFLQLLLLKEDLFALRGQNKAYERPAYQFLLGVAAGLTVLCKQTFGLFVAAASWLCGLYVLCCLKKDRKESCKLLLARAAGVLCVGLLFLLYLFGTGTFDDFWDMAVAGISTFSSSYSYITLASEKGGYLIACIGAPVLIVVSVIVGLWKRRTLYGQTLLLICFYGFGGLINMYPMANAYHFSVTVMPFLLLIVALLPSSLWHHRLINLVGGAAAAALGCYLVICIPYDTLDDHHLCTTLDQFEGIFISDDMEEDILTVTAYVCALEEDGKTVYILDNRAASYFLPLHEYHKYYDMFLKGNLGTTPPEDLLAAACEEDVIFLLPNSERKEWQYPRAEVNALKEELHKVGSVGEFEVYAVTGEAG